MRYKCSASQDGQRGSCRFRKSAICLRNAGMERGLCRPHQRGATLIAKIGYAAVLRFPPFGLHPSSAPPGRHEGGSLDCRVETNWGIDRRWRARSSPPLCEPEAWRSGWDLIPPSCEKLVGVDPGLPLSRRRFRSSHVDFQEGDASKVVYLDVGMVLHQSPKQPASLIHQNKARMSAEELV
jgi:hypothetical protein